MSSLFGNQSSLNSSSNLVEFRAGRMNLVGKMVHPDTRKGLVYVYQSDDQLIHFCWKDRNTGNVEDDLIVFADDCEFKRVEQCKTGRVFLLRFKSSDRKLFFWMQEPKTDKDEEWCRRINELINHPPTGSSSGSRGQSGENNDLQYMLNNMSQQQLMQLFGGVGQMGGLSSLLGQMNRGSSSGGGSGVSSSARNVGSPSSRTASSSTPTTATAATGSTATSVSTPTATIPATTPKAPKKSNNGAASANTSGDSRVLLADLQSYLAGINASGSSTSSRRNVDLSSSINSDALNTILQDPQNVDALVAHLPEVDGDEDKKQQLKDTLSSPQFQQALSTFSSALQSGQLGPVVSQFKLSSDAVAAAVSGDLEQFVKALERTVTKDTAAAAAKQESEEAKNDDDDQMTLG